MKYNSINNVRPVDEHGQGLVEYALILVFVALAVIIMLTLLHEVLGEIYCEIVLAIGGDGGTACPVSSLPAYLIHLV